MVEDSSVIALDMLITMGQNNLPEPPLNLIIRINVGHIKYQPTPNF